MTLKEIQKKRNGLIAERNKLTEQIGQLARKIQELFLPKLLEVVRGSKWVVHPVVQECLSDMGRFELRPADYAVAKSIFGVFDAFKDAPTLYFRDTETSVEFVGGVALTVRKGDRTPFILVEENAEVIPFLKKHKITLDFSRWEGELSRAKKELGCE